MDSNQNKPRSLVYFGLYSISDGIYVFVIYCMALMSVPIHGNTGSLEMMSRV